MIGELFFVFVVFQSHVARLYNSYKGLIMAGYQGWFNCEGDGADRGWRHYTPRNSIFAPGNTKVDFLPDIREYEKLYDTGYKNPNGSTLRVYSPYDTSSVNLHFKWMNDYGIDGVFLQRFVGEISNDSGKRHFNRVLDTAVNSSANYNKTISVMYDLSGMPSNGVDILLDDAAWLLSNYRLSERNLAPSYLFHNNKPLIVVWGVGFNDNRNYGFPEVNRIIDGLKQLGYSVMLGVPTFWRSLERDTLNDPELHNVIKKCDIIMPWFVGRFGRRDYNDNNNPFKQLVIDDISWCKAAGVDYAPLSFPGFSWRNMNQDSTPISREKGGFMWDQFYHQIAVAKAEMIYIAMFDEIDEGTAINKCLNLKDLPDNGDIPYNGIEDDLPTDYYLWLVGKAGAALRGEFQITPDIPARD